MSKYLALIALFSLSAGIPQDQLESKENYIRISKFVQNPPQITQSNPNEVDENQKIKELLKQFKVVQNASGTISLPQQQRLNERLIDAQILKKFPIYMNEADASKYRILSVPVPEGFQSKMPVNKPNMDIDPKVIIELQE